MNKDVIIGVAVSILLHGGFLLGGGLFKSEPAAVEAKKEEIPVVELMQMPVVEPETPEIVEATDAAASDISDLAPPMQADTPSAVIDSPFIQQIQAPPPPGLPRATGAITIPPGRPASGMSSGLTNIFDLANLDQRPEARFRVNPTYPFELKRAGIQGEVMIGFIVDSSGAVRDPFVVRSSHREFEAPALQAVAKWKFTPGKKAGAAVNTRMQVPIAFTLNRQS